MPLLVVFESLALPLPPVVLFVGNMRATANNNKQKHRNKMNANCRAFIKRAAPPSPNFSYRDAEPKEIELINIESKLQW